MAIRLKLDRDGRIEAIEVDSVEEAIAYQRQAHRNGTVSKGENRPAATGTDDALPVAAQKLVELLMVEPHGVETSTLAAVLGLKEAKAIGGTVTSLTSWGRRNGLTKRNLLVKGRKANGHGKTVRTMALSESFRKMINEGKVPGMKLDT